MDFEAFRKKKKEDEERQRKAAAEAERGTASGKESTWIEGLGPAEIANPRVKGFVLGRYRKQRVDPRELNKPAQFETYSAKTSASISRRVECCNEAVAPEVALVVCHGCRKLYHPQCLMDATEGVCCEGKAVLLAPPPRLRPQKAIEQEQATEGGEKPKGMTKF